MTIRYDTIEKHVPSGRTEVIHKGETLWMAITRAKVGSLEGAPDYMRKRPASLFLGTTRGGIFEYTAVRQD